MAENEKSGLDDLYGAVVSRTTHQMTTPARVSAEEMAKAQTGAKRRLPTGSVVDNFPAPSKKNLPLGHDGRLSAEEEEYLRGLGWDVQDYKRAFGPRQIELYLQGCLNDLIDFSEKKYKLLEVQRKQFARQTKQQAEEEIQKKRPMNALKVLERWGTAVGTKSNDDLMRELPGRKKKSLEAKTAPAAPSEDELGSDDE